MITLLGRIVFPNNWWKVNISLPGFANSCMSPQCSFSMDIDKKFWKLVNNIKYQPPWLEIIGCQEKGRFPNVLSHKLPVCHRAAVAGGKPHLNISAHPTTAHFWLFITSSFHDFRLLMSTNSVGKWWSLVRKTPDILFIFSYVLHFTLDPHPQCNLLCMGCTG